VDIGFGDAASPRLLDYPTLLATPAPRVQAYPMESVIAEKVEATVSLGLLNSRMKDCGGRGFKSRPAHQPFVFQPFAGCKSSVWTWHFCTEGLFFQLRDEMPQPEIFLSTI
jgi:hypothetical protein